MISSTPKPSTAELSNREIYESRYSAACLKPHHRGDYFGNLFYLRQDMIKQLGHGKRILDIGCGSGAYLIPLLEEDFDIVGLDFSQKLLNELKQEWDQRGRDPVRLCLICADARDIPATDGSFDMVFSISTLYTVSEVERTLKDVWRVLKKDGLAILELGNLRSLNTIEAKRASTGVQSYHVRLGWLANQLCRLGFEVLEWRAFQLFPLYGGGTPLAVRFLNPLLRQFLAREHDQTMLDEAVSSSPLLSRFAFRYLLVLRKTKGPLASSRLLKPVKIDSARWKRPEVERRRAAAKEMFNRGQILQAVQALVELLHEDPTDALSALALAEMYDAPEEQAFVARYRKVVERATRIFGAHGQEAEAVQTVAVQESTQTLVSPQSRQSNKGVQQASKISVVLPTYNQIAMLSGAVASVLKQSYQDFKLIIVNDGSTDGTREYLESLKDPRIQVIHQANQRLPGALNTGFRAARGKLLTWVSSDNYCAPYFLEALVGALAAYPEAGLAYADFFLIDANDRIISRTSVPDYGYRSLLIRNDGNAAFIYRRACMEQVGLYDTELEGAEDWDYWIRIAEQFGFVYVPEALCYYRLHEKSMQSTMRPQVNIAARKTIENALARKGGNINLAELYPSLSTCRDQKGALFAAVFDFGTNLLQARVRMEKIFVPFLEKAVELKPGFIPAYINLGVAYGYSKQWEKAQRCVEKLKDVTESNLVPIIKQLTEACQYRSPQALNNVPLFRLNKQSTELFQRERALRRVYSFTLDSSTDAR